MFHAFCFFPKLSGDQSEELCRTLGTWNNPLFVSNLICCDCRLLLFLWIIGCIACGKPSSKENIRPVQIRLAAEPDRLHPLLSRSSYSEQVHQHLFLSLLRVAPDDLSLQPLLAAQRPQQQLNEDGQLEFRFRLHPDARWSDGQAVLAEDVLFTLKMIFHPEVPVGHYRAYLDFIEDVRLDETDRRALTFVCRRPYILAEAAIGLLPIFPRKKLDPNDLLDAIPFAPWIKSEQTDPAMEPNKSLQALAKEFVRPRDAEEWGSFPLSGPYRLSEWAAGRFLRLEKRADWWAEGQQSVVRMAQPSEMIYRFVPDIQAAMNLLRAGELDVLSDVPIEDVKRWREAETQVPPVRLHTPLKLSYYQIALQNDHPILGDRNVRKALAHLLDLETAIELLFGGAAERLVGPIHPSKEYCDRSLVPIPFDPEKARQLLVESGWSDRDGDGLLDKQVDGIDRPLRLTYKVDPRNQIGVDIGLMLQQNARSIGCQIDIDSRAFNTLLQEYRRSDFELFYIAKGQLPFPDDLKQSWHSESLGSGGSNRIGFGNAELDAIIDGIRRQMDPILRKPLYLKAQKMIYEQQPCIFLFSPRERIAIHRRFNAKSSVLRPGYFPQEFSLAGKD